jgi:hypothetical protein
MISVQFNIRTRTYIVPTLNVVKNTYFDNTSQFVMYSCLDWLIIVLEIRSNFNR